MSNEQNHDLGLINDVGLISYSSPSENFRTPPKDIQELIAFCARVSNPGNQVNHGTSDRLLRYLIKNKHWSPFEMASMCLEINTTRDVSRQIIRHRSFSFQEFSQRYANPLQGTNMLYQYRGVRLQDPKNRQNSLETDDTALQTKWMRMQDEVAQAASKVYREALELGIAKEVARAVLPEGLTLSRLYMNGTIRSWIHYIELRTEKGTQKEHQQIAFKCLDILTELMPIFGPDSNSAIEFGPRPQL